MPELANGFSEHGELSQLLVRVTDSGAVDAASAEDWLASLLRTADTLAQIELALAALGLSLLVVHDANELLGDMPGSYMLGDPSHPLLSIAALFVGMNRRCEFVTSEGRETEATQALAGRYWINDLVDVVNRELEATC